MEELKTIEFGDAEDEADDIDGMVSTKKNPKKCGGFQGMGLSPCVLKAILKRGYKIPTPIQRKTIPIALEGRDLVAMARTGSGKTACFLIPLLEKLKTRNAKSGARALILSPTRELALQTLKFIKELGKFTGLKAAVILGGDSMDNQFSLIHGNPDVIVATPGRFLHLCVEMDLALKNVEFVVFDEADRLFEMGWGEQIHEITNRLPENRQTLLFSATLPKVLVEFSKAGLCDPTLIRLDVESKLPEQLTLSFITCRKEEKLPVLLCLVKYVIKEDSQIVIFAATQHHVDYIHMILDHANITNTFIYSSLDSAARKINAAKFRSGKTKVLIVTDVAARGLDIPHLDNVINYNFPAKSKLFVHRVGRCARAGRSGTAYNIVANDEYPYLLDLHLFLGLKLNILPIDGTGQFTSGAIGKMPAAMIEQELGELQCWHETSTDLRNMENVCRNAYQQYLRSRPAATVDSIRKAKELEISNAGVISEYNKEEIVPDVNDLLAKMKKYRPAGTIFEIGMKPSSIDYKVMKTKREFHKDKIRNFQDKEIERKKNFSAINSRGKSTLDKSDADDIAATFSKVVTDRKRRLDDLYRPRKKKNRDDVKDSEFYIPYSAGDKHTEEGLAVNNFATAAEKEQMDLTGDTEESRRLQGQIKKWDRKKKKMITVNNNPKTGKIRTESGAWIPATYKTDRYRQWKEKSKVGDNADSDGEEPEDLRKLKSAPNTHWARHNQKLKEKIKMKQELRTPEQILKKRKLDEKKRNRSGRKGKGKKGKGRR